MLVLKGRKERQTYREREGAEREIWKIKNIRIKDEREMFIFAASINEIVWLQQL